MKGERTNLDFSEHELHITKTNEVLIHYLKKPNTSWDSVKFINTNGIMAVTGDYGNWIFCREFHPSPKSGVSEHYWCEKLGLYSKQDPYEYDRDATEKELKQQLENLNETGYEGEQLQEIREYLEECIQEVDYEYGYISFAYQNYPDGWDSECVVFEKRINHQLLAVFDTFDEICRRLKEEEITKTEAA